MARINSAPARQRKARRASELAHRFIGGWCGPNKTESRPGRQRIAFHGPGRLFLRRLMKHTNKCPKCGSSDVIADAKAIDRTPNRNESNPRGPDLTLATFRKPDALLFTGQQATTLSAWVCADCGFVEFYADSPK